MAAVQSLATLVVILGAGYGLAVVLDAIVRGGGDQ